MVGPREAVDGPGLIVVIARVDAVGKRIEIMPVLTLGDYYKHYLDGEHRGTGFLLLNSGSLGFMNNNGGAHPQVPLMYGTSLPMGSSGSASPYEGVILVNDNPLLKQIVRTAVLTATPTLRGDVGL